MLHSNGVPCLTGQARAHVKGQHEDSLSSRGSGDCRHAQAALARTTQKQPAGSSSSMRSLPSFESACACCHMLLRCCAWLPAPGAHAGR